LEMSTSILIGLATERAGLHHCDKGHLDLKIFPSGVNLGYGGNLVGKQSEVDEDILHY
jgi:hypothetical protein